jgi:hypothetical protein
MTMYTSEVRSHRFPESYSLKFKITLTEGQPIARPLYIQEVKYTQEMWTSMPLVGFKVTIPVLLMYKSLYASDSDAAMTHEG